MTLTFSDALIKYLNANRYTNIQVYLDRLDGC